MSVLPIFLYGTKVLKKKAKPVEHLDDSTIKLIIDMFETMHKAKGIGLAATQVGELKRVITIDISMDEANAEGEQEDSLHPTSPDLPRVLTLINPEIIYEEGKWTMEEGCLSVPDIHGEVERAEKIKIRYRDGEFKEQELLMDGLLARVALHEIDHLNGVLFVDRMKKTKRLALTSSLRAIRKGKIETDYSSIKTDEE